MAEIPEVPIVRKTSKDSPIYEDQRWLIPVITLFCLGVISHLPFQGQIVWDDGGNFALAVEHFDMRLQQPQLQVTTDYVKLISPTQN